MLKRLEDEGSFRSQIRMMTSLECIVGFIQEHVAEVDQLGITKTCPKKKGIIKQTKQRRTNMQKSLYRYNKDIRHTPRYRDYFDPSLQAENRLLGIGEMVSSIGDSRRVF